MLVGSVPKTIVNTDHSQFSVDFFLGVAFPVHCTALFFLGVGFLVLQKHMGVFLGIRFGSSSRRVRYPILGCHLVRGLCQPSMA